MTSSTCGLPLTLPIPNYSSLRASEDGTIYAKIDGRWSQLPTMKGSAGYRVIRHDGRLLNVHRLICAAFHEQPPGSDPLVAHHKNGDKEDNRAANLVWTTYAENSRAYLEEQGRKLTVDAVIDARRKVRGGEGAQAVEQLLSHDVNMLTARRALNGYCWGWLDEPPVGRDAASRALASYRALSKGEEGEQ